MTPLERVLRPLEEAAPALRTLAEYRTPADLAAALRTVRGAAAESLRLLLRESSGAPDAARLSALAEDTALADVVTALRRAEVISMEVAGGMHVLAAAVERAAVGDVRAADADAARTAVQLLREEAATALEAPGGPMAMEAGLGAAAEVPRKGAGGPGALSRPEARGDVWARRREAAAAAELHSAPTEPAMAAAGRGPDRAGHAPSRGLGGRLLRRPHGRPAGFVLWAVVLLVLLMGTYVGLRRLGADDAAMAQGVQAFRQEHFTEAQAAFRAVVEADADNVTAWLYLGRIARREARWADAAEALERGAVADPEDAAVQRELGYLFMDLDEPARAATRFDRARQLEPESTAAWIGFIRALRAAGDAQAAVWLDRAPADVKAALGGATPITSTP